MSNNPTPANDIYQRLGAQKDSSAQIIHKHFLKLVCPLLKKIKASGENHPELLDQLRELWVAHDILVDPDCRTDYDLRSLGIVTSDNTLEEEAQTRSITFADQSGQYTTPSWRIGELLQVLGMLEQAELDIACDMHKAMPEMQFGCFLVKQDFLTEAQLQTVLIGQTLIRAGEITLLQLIEVMAEVKKSNRDFKEILLESGYLKNPSLYKFNDKT